MIFPLIGSNAAEIHANRNPRLKFKAYSDDGYRRKQSGGKPRFHRTRHEGKHANRAPIV
jgi:hypothetical protein